MSNAPKRTRLTTDARREQLLRVGARMFAERPYEAVAITEIAELAGVSRGLLYHYFPSKRDFAVAITQHACADMFADASPDPSLPVRDRLAAVLDAYFEFAAANSDGFRAMHRNLIADEAVRELRAQDLAQHEASVIAAFGLSDGTSTVPDVVRISIRGWLALTITVVLEWLDHGEADQGVARDVCIDALLSVLASSGALGQAKGA